MPDYAEDQLPETGALHWGHNDAFPGKVEELVKKAYKVRHEQQARCRRINIDAKKRKIAN